MADQRARLRARRKRNLLWATVVAVVLSVVAPSWFLTILAVAVGLALLLGRRRG